MFENYAKELVRYPELGISVDFSKLPLDAEFLGNMESKIQRAYADMKSLESGAIANPDEGRQVGHYWLRTPELAPSQELKDQITQPLNDLKNFAKEVIDGKITPPKAPRYTHFLLIGIGGSALGPQLVADALPSAGGLIPVFMDNSDPDGMTKTLKKLNLAETLVLVISKSGGTPETRNGMLEAEAAYKAAGLDFGSQAVAVTGVDSKLDKHAVENKWLKRFPMEDWVGGRTSVMSVVGLVPAALGGVDIDAFLAGASQMDAKTRLTNTAQNAAMKLALAWYKAGNGRGEKDMVVLPYKDSLVLFSKYLQQLLMESLGKEKDLDGQIVHQGIAVYGNKGSTDQHAYVQQLRDGVANFFAVFIEVRKSLQTGVQVEPSVSSGDYLQGFLRGTRQALAAAGRPSVTISIPQVDAVQLGALIALFERSVSFYASLVNINAYHQPGVEAGKKAAGEFLSLLGKVRDALTNQPETAIKLATRLGADPEAVYHALNHMAANDSAVSVELGADPSLDQFHC